MVAFGVPFALNAKLHCDFHMLMVVLVLVSVLMIVNFLVLMVVLVLVNVVMIVLVLVLAQVASGVEPDVLCFAAATRCSRVKGDWATTVRLVETALRKGLLPNSETFQVRRSWVGGRRTGGGGGVICL